ncbi:MAG: short-chain fatty acid transporter [Clostridia bacterium]|nr:short-chain fatty acid transporter [Clostridia bacterium]
MSNGNVELKKEGAVGWQEKLGLVFPNPATILFILTIIFVIISGPLTGKSFPEIIQFWGKGFISLYPFSMEIILLFLTGYALAITPVFQKTIRSLAEKPQSSPQAALYLAAVSIFLSWFNWGLGIIGGILLARETARELHAKGKTVNYSLLITSGCAGLVVWETGLSGVVPLYLAEKGHFFSKIIQLLPLSQTVLSPANIITSLLLVIIIPIVCYLLHPKGGVPLTQEQLQAEGLEEGSRGDRGPVKVIAERLERSTTLNVIMGLVALIAMIMVFSGGGNLNLKNYLFIALLLGISIRKEPMDYPPDFAKGTKLLWFVAPILVMFAALQGVINLSGLGEGIGKWLAGISSSGTYPVTTFILAAITNLLVPVTGAQWMVEGNFILSGAKAVNASIPATVLAFGYGAAWAKLIQLFFLLPWLGVTEVRVKDVAKYFSIIALASLIIFLGSLLIFW